MTATDAPAPRLQLGRVGLWTGSLDVPPMAEAREVAAEVESLGYAAVWIPEIAGRDPLVLSALLLASTSTLVMATGIASIWARDAVAMVEGHRTLTEAFPERFLLGLGVSHHTIVEGLRGHQYVKPLEAMRSYLQAMDTSPFTACRPTTPPPVRQPAGAHGAVPAAHGHTPVPRGPPHDAPPPGPRCPPAQDAGAVGAADRRRPPLLRARRSHGHGPPGARARAAAVHGTG